jgi:hypothetical protein
MKAELKKWIAGGYGETLTAPARVRPLRHVQGLRQTASGYGNKLATPYQVQINSRWRRVYCCCFSNSGTCYVGKPGAWEYIVTDIKDKRP